MTGSMNTVNELHPARCPACGQPPDYCLGHGPLGDPLAYLILGSHDLGDHSQCHPAGCVQSLKIGGGHD